MTSTPDGFDLPAIATRAEVEILTIDVAEVSLGAGESALATAELGYYEAELTSLRDAARTLSEPERSTD